MIEVITIVKKDDKVVGGLSKEISIDTKAQDLNGLYLDLLDRVEELTKEDHYGHNVDVTDFQLKDSGGRGYCSDCGDYFELTENDTLEPYDIVNDR
jgi:hypothetical protein